MNAQEVYDNVVRHLYEQNARSLLSKKQQNKLKGSNGCAYRSENGMKCAIGCLIPDDAYDPAIEGHTALFALKKCGLDELRFDHIELLEQLQDIHDNFEPDEWQNKLVKLADRIGLIPMKRDDIANGEA